MLTSRYSLPYHHVVLMKVTLMYIRMCSKVVLVDDHVNFNHRRDEVNLLFALFFPPMSESVSLLYVR